MDFVSALTSQIATTPFFNPASISSGSFGNSLLREEAKKREQDIGESMSKLMPKGGRLEQDDMEGAEEKDWVRANEYMTVDDIYPRRLNNEAHLNLLATVYNP